MAESRTIQFRQALREAMTEEMHGNDNIFLMGEEVGEYNGAYKVTQGMLDEFGYRRVIDTPIAELGFAGLGVGASMNGLRPIVEFMTWNFALLAIDQVVNSAAKMLNMSGGQYYCPITFRGPTGSAGQLGATHSQSFDNWMANTPGLKVMVPSDPYDAKGLLRSAINDDDPSIFMESEVMYGDEGTVPAETYTLPIGQAKVKREGSDVTLVGYGKMMKEVFKAADILEQEYEVSAEVIDLRSLRPLDFQTIVDSVQKTNRIVAVEESWPLAAMCSEITYQVQKHAFDYLDAPVKRVTGADVPMSYSGVLVDAFLPDPNKIVQQAKAALYIS
jgi:Pyruvate/2-oxoglutarate dehydrogenase complex, dehydrogenase (E1) component, eukaryotic type, beta subunit